MAFGPLELASFELVSADPTALWKGRFWFNTAETKFKYYDGAAVQVLLISLGSIAVVDNTFTIQDNTTPTKVIKFEASSLTGTRTFILPDYDDTLVTLTSAGTLTGKTISGSVNTITNVSLTTGVTGTLPIGNGGTGQTTANPAFNALAPTTTRGDLITRDATVNVRLAVGAASTVLKSDGTDPAYGFVVDANVDAAAAIARSKIATGTADHVVINSGTGALSSEAALSATRGGTGVSNNAACTTTRVNNFAKTETLTAVTSITYPTTGTLATLAGVEALSGKTIDVLRTNVVNDAATGTAQTLSAITATLTRLTAAGTLVSITGIPQPSPANQVILILENRTGSTVTILNDVGATAVDRIITGTAADVNMASNATLLFVYDTSSSRWQVIGGSGGGSSGFAATQIVPISSSTGLTDHAIHSVDTTAARALTFPQVANGYWEVKDVTISAQTNNITITPTTGLIDGAASTTINSDGGSVRFYSNGTNAFLI